MIFQSILTELFEKLTVFHTYFSRFGSNNITAGATVARSTKCVTDGDIYYFPFQLPNMEKCPDADYVKKLAALIKLTN